MKKILLTLFSVVVLLVSCKCKKATVATTEAPVMATTDASQSNLVENTTTMTVTNPQEKGTFVEYNANTRGYHLRIRLTADSFKYTNNRDSENFESLKLTAKQLEELHKLVGAIALEDLDKMQAPTQLRYHDGAAHADMTIHKEGKEYHSVGFDHGHPPAGLEKFVNKLVSYIK